MGCSAGEWIRMERHRLAWKAMEWCGHKWLKKEELEWGGVNGKRVR